MAVVCLAGLGLALRLVNAQTARVHDDELHYAEDALWAASPLGFGEATAFLRHHPGEHRRLDPATGTRRPWGQPGEIARLAHPALVPWVEGPVVAAFGARTPHDAVRIGRRLSCLLDALTVPLLPPLAAALGAPPAAGLVAAALYAVYPPAVTYGSLDYLDPPLAPLLVVLLLGVLNLRRGLWVWAGVGLANGLLLATKQTGMVVLPLVPAAALLFGPRSARGLAVWAGTTLLVLCLVVDPVAYVHGLRHPSRPIGELHLDPLSLLAANAAFLARPDAYYWLSFARHGEPLAPFFARVHPFLTPACLAVYALGLVAALAAGAGRRLLVLYAPAALTLAAILPSDGLWRFHLLSPLVCVAAALELARLPGRRGFAALILAGLAAAPALVPQRPAEDGTVDLADLVRTNPQAPQLQRFHGPALPLVVWLSPGTMLERRLWLAPGDYDVSVTASSPAALSLDGRPVPGTGSTPMSVALDGFVHRLAFSFPQGGVLRRLGIRRLDGNAPQIGAHRRTAAG